MIQKTKNLLFVIAVLTMLLGIILFFQAICGSLANIWLWDELGNSATNMSWPNVFEKSLWGLGLIAASCFSFAATIFKRKHHKEPFLFTGRDLQTTNM